MCPMASSHALFEQKEIDKLSRTGLVVGRDRVHYLDNGTPTTNLLTITILINSIISTPDVKFVTMNIKDFYLNTRATRYKYM